MVSNNRRNQNNIAKQLGPISIYAAFGRSAIGRNGADDEGRRERERVVETGGLEWDPRRRLAAVGCSRSAANPPTGRPHSNQPVGPLTDDCWPIVMIAVIIGSS